MKMLPQFLFWLGLISVPFAWLVWYVGPQMEMKLAKYPVKVFASHSGFFSSSLMVLPVTGLTRCMLPHTRQVTAS